MSDETREHKLEAIIVDVMSDMRDWNVTFHNTELSKKRSQEIAHDLIEIFDTYYKRNAS